MVKPSVVLIVAFFFAVCQQRCALAWTPRSSLCHQARSFRMQRTKDRSYPLYSSFKTTEDKTVVENKQYASETYTPQEWEQLVADHAWAYSNTPHEACTSYECDSIQGKVPRDLSGTLYRNGPGNFERQGQRYKHVLDGDGFVAAFSFDSGKVHYTGRFVETEYYQKESSQNKILYRNVFGTQPRGGVLANAFDVELKNVANTNIMEWGGRLFAFWEGGRPYELDKNLKTLKPDPSLSLLTGLGRPSPTWRGITIDEGGPIDAALNLGRMFTAHPHIWQNQTLVGYRSALNPTDDIRKIEFVEYNRQWNETITAKYGLPGAPSASHDFAMSKDYYCFFENRLGLDLPPFVMGLKSCAEVMELSLKEPTILHLVPRSTDKKALQFQVPPYFNIHTAPTVLEEEENNRLTIYHNGWNLLDERFFPKDSDTSPFLGEWGGERPAVDETPGAHLYRTTIDLNAECLVQHEQVMPGLVMEFPTQDPQSPHQLYMGVCSTNNISKPFDAIGKIDLQTGKLECWWAEPRVFVGEPVLVPKRHKEGVWILVLLHDANSRRASLAILDGEKIENGPVCRIHLRHHLTLGLHGSFSEQPPR